MVRKLPYTPIAQNIEMEKVRVSSDPSRLARRNKPGVNVNEHGWVKVNVGGTEEWMAFFEGQGVNPKEPWITLSFNRPHGLVFAYAAQQSDEDAIAVKFNEETRTYTTHFAPAFDQCPSLRPAGPVEATFEPKVDKEGTACLSIKIKGAPAKRKGAATLEEMAARAEEEAARKSTKAGLKLRIAAAKQGGGTTGGGESAPPTAEN
ncbi:MAG: hypothetical protein K0R39_4938 [Symbiobacteriaceae bacterium]|jgi:hypothetical protein|nr:hypothetical protein [Symbiobacteriaceae bacterium]